jgi:non-ribosomal peptide synthetase component E (peptide arylation enzyme)
MVGSAFETRLTPALSRRWRDAGLWSDDGFADVLARRVQEVPDREALCDGRKRITYRQLSEGIDRVAARLRALGIGEGDVVAIQMPNWVEFAFVFFALERLAGIAVTLGVDFRRRELEYMLRFADAKMLICCREFRGFDHVALAEELRGILPGLSLIGVIRGSAGPGIVSLDDTIAQSGRPAGFTPAHQGADAVMRMAFTSGTTGNPKGVMHSHNTTLSAARILNGDLGLNARDTMLAWLPVCLNWGYLTVVQSVLAGARVVLLERFQPRPALDLIESERVTYIPTAPASLTAILQEPDIARRDLSSLRIVVSGGASAPVETIRAWRRIASGFLLELLGMLETGYQTYTRSADDPERVAGSVGTPASHMGLRLIDTDLHEVPPGEVGEICADGPSVHLGYHNNPPANSESFLPGDWFRSGDLGMIDSDGNLRVVGRLKEMINRGGKKFFPREIEEILYTHPKVLYAAIVGIPDARLGERNCLCMVPKPGEQPALQELIDFLGDSVATYKLPERLELFDQFPFTPSGKIQRHTLVRAVVARMEGTHG